MRFFDWLPDIDFDVPIFTTMAILRANKHFAHDIIAYFAMADNDTMMPYFAYASDADSRWRQ